MIHKMYRKIKQKANNKLSYETAFRVFVLFRRRKCQTVRVIYPTFEKEFIYDRRGRKTHERDVLAGAGQEYMTLFSYDDAGNLISKTDKEDNITTYQYDALNRLTNVTSETNPTNYVYDSRDNLLELTDANGKYHKV